MDNLRGKGWFGSSVVVGRRKAAKAATTEHQLTPDFVARDLATMLAGTMDSPEVAEVLAEADETYLPERRLEWLIINTFATTQGFLASDLSEPFKQAFVPAFVSAVASYSFHKFESREQFTAQFYERVRRGAEGEYPLEFEVGRLTSTSSGRLAPHAEALRRLCVER